MIYRNPFRLPDNLHISTLLVLIVLFTGQYLYGQDIKEARGVIERFCKKKIPMTLSLSLEKDNGRDRFEFSAENGHLSLRGSSGVALCRAFYSYLKANKAGIASWTGNRCELPDRLPDSPPVQVRSPYLHHYYLNVVTYGYSMPYWDWKRWEREIDWMALHGIDMPLALVANEAISARIWKKLGLTDEEISAYFVGPAHFPWMRMGNISGIDGPLPASWHKKQIALQHRILRRMKALGMKPICPGFAGFVPQALKRLYPDINMVETSWAGSFHNWMLMPDHPLFRRIGQMFISEWEKEFGSNDYYIVDSFNEMEIPFPPKGSPERFRLTADYGEAVYSSIQAGNPKATWVMQGWMFGFQRDIWDYETLQALVSRVPDDRMLLLDLAVDYNKHFWHSQVNWDFYRGYFNKPWVYSVIPNMGGKTGLTGVLEFYANGRLEALRSPNRGRLAGYGMAPEGIENNEVIYELVADGGWTAAPIDLDKWLEDYSTCRYGQTTGNVTAFWNGLRESVYGSFTDHPRYNWQFRPGRVGKGSIQTNESFYKGIEHLAEAIPDLGRSALFRADMLEMAVQYLGGKMEILVQAAAQTYLAGDTAQTRRLEEEFLCLAEGADRLLASHPVLRLDRWLDFARRQGQTSALSDYYERNARRIVTIWGPPIDDYSARIWSGLIRDYYAPRWKHFFESRRTGNSFDFAAWEREWVEKRKGVSPVRPYDNPMEACRTWLRRAARITPALLTGTEGEELGQWTPTGLKTEWQEMSWTLSASKLRTLRGVVFQYTRGANKLEIEEVSVEADGQILAREKHFGETGLINRNNAYLFRQSLHAPANNSCHIRAKVRSDGSCDSYGRILILGH